MSKLCTRKIMIMHCKLQNEAQLFGVDWEGPSTASDDDDCLVVPDTRNPLTNSDFEDLKASIPPLAPSSHYGIDLFEETKCFVSNKLRCIV